MPDFFVIFISILVDDLDKCFSWDDIFVRFEKYKDYNIIINFQLTEIEENFCGQDSQCFCSHKCFVNNMAIITNIKNNITFWIGCDCCNKTGIITKTEFQKKVRNNRSQVMKKYIAKKEVERIQKLELKALEIKKQQELKLAEKFKKCINCLEYKILLSEPEWKKNCGRCFYEIENSKKVTGVCLLKMKK